MALRKINPVPASIFSLADDKKMWVTEASTLAGYGGGRIIYDDALDVGFAVENPKTGVTVTFRETGFQRGNDGDIMFWDFEVVPQHRRLMKVADFSVRVFND